MQRISARESDAAVASALKRRRAWFRRGKAPRIRQSEAEGTSTAALASTQPRQSGTIFPSVGSKPPSCAHAVDGKAAEANLVSRGRSNEAAHTQQTRNETRNGGRRARASRLKTRLGFFGESGPDWGGRPRATFATPSNERSSRSRWRDSSRWYLTASRESICAREIVRDRADH
eukprot:870071-Pleurochrysis_carterae.AAC.2